MVVETNWLHPSVYLFFTFALSLSLSARVFVYVLFCLEIVFDDVFTDRPFELCRFFSIHSIYPALGLHHLILIQKFEPSQENIYDAIFLSSRDSIVVERAAKLDCSSPNSLFNLVCDSSSLFCFKYLWLVSIQFSSDVCPQRVDDGSFKLVFPS